MSSKLPISLFGKSASAFAISEKGICDGKDLLVGFQDWLQGYEVGLALHEALIPDFTFRVRQIHGRNVKAQIRSRQLAAQLVWGE
jgi:hypothetical protein